MVGFTLLLNNLRISEWSAAKGVIKRLADRKTEPNSLKKKLCLIPK